MANTDELQRTHRLLNAIAAGSESGVAALQAKAKLRHVFGGSAPIAGRVTGEISRVNTWMDELDTASGAFSVENEESAPLSRVQQALVLARELEHDLIALAREIEQLLATDGELLNRVLVARGLCALVRAATYQERFARKQLDFAKRSGHDSEFSEIETRIGEAVARLSEIEPWMERLRADKGLPPDAREQLRTHLDALPNELRSLAAGVRSTIILVTTGNAGDHVLDTAQRNAWQALGIPEDEATTWKTFGFDPTTARAYMDAGIDDPDDAQSWSLLGLTPVEARSWQGRNIDPAELGAWRRADFDLRNGDIERWRAAGVTDPEEARGWRNAGYARPDECEAWRERGLHAAHARLFGSLDELQRWLDAGFSEEDAVRWRSIGASIAEARSWSDSGISDAAEADAWRSDGFAEPERASDWRRRGFDAAASAEWSAIGVNAEEARDWTERGIDKPEEVAERKRTGTGPVGSGPTEHEGAGEVDDENEPEGSTRPLGSTLLGAGDPVDDDALGQVIDDAIRARRDSQTTQAVEADSSAEHEESAPESADGVARVAAEGPESTISSTLPHIPYSELPLPKSGGPPPVPPSPPQHAKTQTDAADSESDSEAAASGESVPVDPSKSGAIWGLGEQGSKRPAASSGFWDTVRMNAEDQTATAPGTDGPGGAPTKEQLAIVLMHRAVMAARDGRSDWVELLLQEGVQRIPTLLPEAFGRAAGRLRPGKPQYMATFVGVITSVALTLGRLRVEDREQNRQLALRALDDFQERVGELPFLARVILELRRAELWIEDETDLLGQSIQQAVERLRALCSLAHERERFPKVLLGELHMTLGLALSKVSIGDQRKHRNEALTHLERARDSIPHEKEPELWARACVLIGNIYRERGGRSHKEDIERAIVYYQDAIRETKPKQHRIVYATAHLGLGLAYLHRVAGDRGENNDMGIRYLNEALKHLTAAETPQEWAQAQFSLGLAYQKRRDGDRAENLQLAMAHYRASLSIYTRYTNPAGWRTVRENLDAAELELEREEK